MEDVGGKEKHRSEKVRKKRSRQLKATMRASFKVLFRGCAVSIGPPPQF